MLPAAAQGIIATECRADDIEVRALLLRINHTDSMLRAVAEREMLLELDGSCRTAIAGLSEIRGDTLYLRGEVYAEDGSERQAYEAEAPVHLAEALGREVGAVLEVRSRHLLKKAG